MASQRLPYSDTAPILTQPDDTEDEDKEGLQAVRESEDEGDVQALTGIPSPHAVLIVGVLCFVNLLNYMDRFTVAGKGGWVKVVEAGILKAFPHLWGRGKGVVKHGGIDCSLPHPAPYVFLSFVL